MFGGLLDVEIQKTLPLFAFFVRLDFGTNFSYLLHIDFSLKILADDPPPTPYLVERNMASFSLCASSIKRYDNLKSQSWRAMFIWTGIINTLWRSNSNVLQLPQLSRNLTDLCADLRVHFSESRFRHHSRVASVYRHEKAPRILVPNLTQNRNN